MQTPATARVVCKNALDVPVSYTREQHGHHVVAVVVAINAGSGWRPGQARRGRSVAVQKKADNLVKMTTSLSMTQGYAKS